MKMKKKTMLCSNRGDSVAFGGRHEEIEREFARN